MVWFVILMLAFGGYVFWNARSEWQGNIPAYFSSRFEMIVGFLFIVVLYTGFENTLPCCYMEDTDGEVINWLAVVLSILSLVIIFRYRNKPV